MREAKVSPESAKGAVDSHDNLPFLAVGAASTEANPDLTSCPVHSKYRNIFNPMCEDEYIEYESPWDAFHRISYCRSRVELFSSFF